ncbi:Unknown protein sequence [Pseudomonas syringae pv. maculicola]|uniref:Uncharacterized protein n=1 Tax=Pseudomonas amygdali pv. lachrymans TaxID=53707 RepID=A0ABR5KVK8_PSEAV|nr:Unknown protein sequence [Pseudomonas syringae pv. maculicola]KPC19056.1 Unknown protein sequence [Pseudomonas amygdali pv. lachrymans]
MVNRARAEATSNDGKKHHAMRRWSRVIEGIFGIFIIF